MSHAYRPPRIERADEAPLLPSIRRLLARHGYVHLAFAHSQQEYEEIGAALGTIALRTDVRIDRHLDRALSQTRAPGLQARRPGVHRADGLSLHSDRPTVNLLSFYCLEQDRRDGALILVDTSDIAAHFTKPERANLEKIEIPYSQRDPHTNVEAYGHQPLLARRGKRWQVYFAAWFLPPPANNDQARLLQKLSAYVAHRREQGAIALRLLPGESVFIDNQRMLHGREAIAPDSKRHLIRYFIVTPTAVGTWEEG